MPADNTAKRKHRFNWVDLLILILAVGIAVMIVLNFLPDENQIGYGDKTVTVEFTIQIDKLNNDLDIELASGDEVTEMSSKEKIGVLSSNPMIVAYPENVFNENSEAIEIVYSDTYSTVYLTIVAEAVETDYGYYVNNVRIAVGSDYDLRISGLEATGSCISVELR